MRIIFFFLIMLTSGHSLLGQKQILKQWDAGDLTSLTFIADLASKVNIISTNSDQLIVSASMEGEYANSLHAGLLQEEGGDWTLVTSFEAFGQTPNDKLAAHKVKSIEIEIQLPRNREVIVMAATASLYVQGSYLNLKAQLLYGNCELQNFIGNASLEVLDGDTTVTANYGIAGTANSKHGNVTNLLPKTGQYRIEVISNNGDILLQNVPR